MKVIASVKTVSPRVLIASLLVILTSWWVINSIVTLVMQGQGWPSLAIAAILLFYSAKVFPRDHVVRSFFRAVWAKA